MKKKNIIRLYLLTGIIVIFSLICLGCGADEEALFMEAESMTEEGTTMESGSAALDSSLSLFEEGIGLVKFCTKALDTAEQKVKILQKDENGELAEVPFAVKKGE